MIRPAWMPRPAPLALALVALASTPALAQAPARTGLWPLFRQSFDIFTVLLLAGSVVAVGIIISAVLEARTHSIAPDDEAEHLLSLARAGRLDEVRAADGDSVVARAARAAALAAPEPASRREAAELAASEACGRWFRRVDVLALIGNLGPLVGLAGTVWGMVLAFSSLGAAGGQANPGALSEGIAKALFHTLLGLMLAIPCLLAHGLLRARVDRLCTRALTLASRIVEAMPPGRS